MRIRKAWIAVAVVVPVALVVTALAGYVFGGACALRHSRHTDDYLIGFRVNEGCGLTLADLGLTELQTREYGAIVLNTRPELNRLRDQIRGKKADLLGLMRAGTGNSQTTTRVLDEIASLQSALERRTVEYILNLRSTLTDPQLPQFDRMARHAVCPWL